jgi:hypothetical protein
MNPSSPAVPSRQRGIVSIVVVVLLIAGVILILSQTLGIVGNRSVDNAQQLDSAAALMLAESGLQRAQAVVGAAASAGTMTNADCVNAGAGGPISLGRGTITFATPVSTPATCSPTSPCQSCTVSATGAVGTTARTLNQTFNIGVVNGTTGKGTTVTMVLENTFSTPAVALFNLAWRRQSAGGGQASATSITVCAVGSCSLRWNLESSSGNPSAGGIGTAVNIAANTVSQTVSQTISVSREYVEVGALFPSTSATAPAVIGSYWSNVNNGNPTAVSSGATSTNSGVAGGGTCDTPANPPGNNTSQSCTKWCTGADTLVFGVAARSATVADQITSVNFNTSGSPAQNVPLTRVVHFPSTGIANASGLLYSEAWYAYNPDFLYQQPATLGATSYPAVLQGVAGATVAPSNMSNGTTTMQVTAATFSDTNSKICIGDVVTRVDNPNRFQANTKITLVPGGGTCSRASGTYAFNLATTGTMNSPSVSATSTAMQVITSAGTISLNVTTTAAIGGTTMTFTAGPVAGVYTLNTAKYLPTTQLFTQGASGLTISTPSGTSTPTVGTIVGVYSGTGAFAAQTKVAASPVPTNTSFTVDTAPSTPIVGAAICGGICAFFNDPSNTGSSTAFTVTKSGGTSQWASGFMCLSGVDKTKIIPVTSSTSNITTWKETIQ